MCLRFSEGTAGSRGQGLASGYLVPGADPLHSGHPSYPGLFLNWADQAVSHILMGHKGEL